jgi:Na+:H+ antiporter, NhaA family
LTDSTPRPRIPAPVRRIFQRLSATEARYIGDILRTETVGGALLLVSAVIALAWANSPWTDAYHRLGTFIPWPGGAALALNIDLTHWASDGLLAIFFFVVGLELKRLFVVGDLRDPRRATVPMVAAVGGMALPAGIYVVVNLGSGGGALRGWAIPTATDVAFALAVLAIISSHLPQGLRTFLLTLAAVDDLFAITIIAVFYTAQVDLLPLVGSLAPIAVFAALVRRGKTWWWLLVPLGVLAWGLMHASGVHPTVAGMLLGFTVPALDRDGTQAGMAERFEHRWRPVSAGVAVPTFAFFAAGVSLRETGFRELLASPVFLGIAAGLVVGKTIGVFGSTYLVARFTRAELGEGIAWTDLLGVALVAGIGFTVSLLIGELAFDTGSERGEHVKAAVLAGSLTSALLAALVLTRRNAVYRRMAQAEVAGQDVSGRS